ncbi:unnamed protein product [Ambrosiozyma monospora]|uniref:Large ribosomal subunit protein bL28m n=1 Tax=Ambrosiozyma monospora TaxID=43982 RepID=A0A9W6YYL2_AMBMO|nr:unnamed protein product [Ambrosiozyma monospora]
MPFTSPMTKLGPLGSSIRRLFSTTAETNARQYRTVVQRQLKEQPQLYEGFERPRNLMIPKEIPQYPAYPYGESRIFKRADRGLYGGQVITFGNQISEMKNKSRRTWLPNVITKSIWSDALQKSVKMKLTARVLKTLTKEGGLDNYLTKEKPARVKELGLFGWQLRHDVLKAKKLAEQKQIKNYEILKNEKGEDVKVYFKGFYQGENVKLTVGKRKLLTKLFPVVKYNTPGHLTFSAFSVPRKTTTISDVLKECEQYKVDLKDVCL